jgi:hypothetical protein
MSKKAPLVDGEQLLLDMGEIRERLKLYAALRVKETDLQQQELEATAALREIRRKLKECRWDLRNATNAVDRTARVVLSEDGSSVNGGAT